MSDSKSNNGCGDDGGCGCMIIILLLMCCMCSGPSEDAPPVTTGPMPILTEGTHGR